MQGWKEETVYHDGDSFFASLCDSISSASESIDLETYIFDREPLVSVARYLAVRLPNPEQPFLNPFDWEAGADSLWKIRLAKRLREMSLEGDKLFAKISDFHGSNGQCIAVIFSGFTDNFQCVYSVRISAS